MVEPFGDGGGGVRENSWNEVDRLGTEVVSCGWWQLFRSAALVTTEVPGSSGELGHFIISLEPSFGLGIKTCVMTWSCWRLPVS